MPEDSGKFLIDISPSVGDDRQECSLIFGMGCAQDRYKKEIVVVVPYFVSSKPYNMKG